MFRTRYVGDRSARPQRLRNAGGHWKQEEMRRQGRRQMGLRSRAWVAPVRAPARLSRSARMLGDSRSSGRRCGNNNNKTCIILCCLVTLLCQVMIVARGHGDHGSTGPVCMRNIGVKLQASYLPGIITVDGDADDWSVVNGHSFMLLQAITDDAAHPYPAGDHSMQIKVAHDGKDVFFLIQVPGAYVYKSDSEKDMASVALIFGVGDDATYHNMGGCPELTMTCNSSTCSGHEVDLMHFYLNKAIPGRLYGSNLFDNINGTGRDSFGNLDDAYCWNPHCRYVDGADPYGTPGNGMNDWSGSWSHSTIDTEYGLVLPDSPYGKVDESGTYTFEFARPLRTNDQLQQDVQFTIGATHRMAAAFWYPLNNEAWESSQHYSASCDWLTLEILPGIGTGLNRSKVGNATVSAFSLLLSLAALSVSVAVGWWVRQTSRVASFNPIVNSL